MRADRLVAALVIMIQQANDNDQDVPPATGEDAL
jgi:hypothetical protein